jgi:YggT family protein
VIARIVDFLIGTLADLLAFVLLLRLYMQAVRAGFANPLGEAVIALTNWIVRPLRRVLPPLGPLDSASLLPAWAVQALALLLTLAARGADFPLAAIAWLSLLDTLRIAVWVAIVALLAMVIVSWVNPHSPFATPLNQLTRPLLAPLRRVLPPLGRIDLSPLVVILLLQVLLIVLDGLR